MNQPNGTRTPTDFQTAVSLAHFDEAEGVPHDAGDGFAVTTDRDGLIQLAIYWTDPPGMGAERHTVVMVSREPRFVEELVRVLTAGVERSRARAAAQNLLIIRRHAPTLTRH